jgi:hypothetical protein
MPLHHESCTGFWALALLDWDFISSTSLPIFPAPSVLSLHISVPTHISTRLWSSTTSCSLSLIVGSIRGCCPLANGVFADTVLVQGGLPSGASAFSWPACWSQGEDKRCGSKSSQVTCRLTERNKQRMWPGLAYVSQIPVNLQKGEVIINDFCIKPLSFEGHFIM